MFDSLKRLRDMLGALAWTRELGSHDAWSRDQLLRHQQSQFSQLVRHAVSNCPFYTRHYAGIDLDGDINPASLPITDKKLLMTNFSEAVVDRRLSLESVQEHIAAIQGDAYLHGEYRVVGTAGTSGFRGFFVYDRAAWRVVLANTLRWNRLIGIRPKLPVRVRIASIGADTPMHVTERIPQSGDVGLFKVAHFEATEPIRRLAARLQEFRPDVILSYPSVATLLADEQLGGRLEIAPKVVSTHSEVLTEEMRSRMLRAWGISPFNHYGLTEEPHVAADCDAHQGLHIFEDTSLVEIVDDDNQPVPDGTPGAKWLLTNLYNFAQPIIRYEVTDILTRAPGICSCGRPFSMISAIGGRSEDVLHLPGSDGQGEIPIPPLSIEMIIEGFKDVAEYVVSHSRERVSVVVVQRPGADQDALEGGIRAALGSMIHAAGAVAPPIEVTFVDRLERRREKMGKLKLVGGEKPVVADGP